MTISATKPTTLFATPGQFLMRKRPIMKHLIIEKLVVIGIALEEPTNSNALNVMICPNAHPAPEIIENTSAIPPGMPIPALKYNSKTYPLSPRIWLTVEFRAVVGNSPQPNNGPNH